MIDSARRTPNLTANMAARHNALSYEGLHPSALWYVEHCGSDFRAALDQNEWSCVVLDRYASLCAERKFELEREQLPRRAPPIKRMHEHYRLT